MAYQIYKFDSVLLPVGNNRQQHSPGQAESSLVDSVGGVFDYYGTYKRHPQRINVELTGLYVGEKAYETDHSGNNIVDHSGNYIITHAATIDLRVQVEALQQKIGARGTLWRRWLSDTSVEQWKTARLLHAPWLQDYEEGALLAELTCVFETWMTGWHAKTQTTTTGNVNNNSAGITVHNGGALRIDDATITITASGADITNMQIVNVAAGIDLRYTDTITDGSAAVIINCGDGTVQTSGGADRYSGFALGSGHTARGWCPLATGSNAFIATVTGQGTVAMKHYNQWP